MNRAELIRLFALNSFCDDYVDIEQITLSISRDSLDCGMTISHAEILQSLRELIEMGYAKAWRLSCWGKPPEEYEGMPPPEDVKHPWGAYFYITPEGMKFHLADHPGWPFEDKGELLKDWTPPTD
jgi:hypothetical protein